MTPISWIAGAKGETGVEGRAGRRRSGGSGDKNGGSAGSGDKDGGSGGEGGGKGAVGGEGATRGTSTQPDVGTAERVAARPASACNLITPARPALSGLHNTPPL